jgi:integrase
MAERITQRTIANLRLPTRANRILYDREIPGFGVRITPAGAVSFILNYRIRGRERRYTIGRHPELTAIAARERAMQLRVGLMDGCDPLEARQQDRLEPTVNELATEYLERHAATHKRASSVRNDRQMINNIIRPALGSLRLQAVGKRDLETLQASYKATPYRANRVLALLSKMFSLATEWEWITDNPARGIPRFHEDKRERWLTEQELHRFTKALDAYPDQNAADALRLLLLTGAREGEVLKADWPQFDLQRGVWTKPSHHTKEQKIEHVPLSAAALDLLRQMKRKAGATGPLFPGVNGKPRVTLRRPWVQICKAVGLSDVITLQGKRRTITRSKPKVRIHDLRHSFASHLVSNGVSLHIVGKLLGHTQAQTTQRYAHVADQAMRDASNRMGEIFRTASKRRKKP